MPISPTDEPSWGLVEWALTVLTTMTGSAVAFMWRLMARLDRVATTVERQRVELDATKRGNDEIHRQLWDRVAQLNNDHHRLRETIAALPTRADLRQTEERINGRIETLVARIDRLLSE
jgi:predicted anti-sigma-YlaC factor YlaD